MIVNNEEIHTAVVIYLGSKRSVFRISKSSYSNGKKEQRVFYIVSKVWLDFVVCD